jgi:hypothetical protein
MATTDRYDFEKHSYSTTELNAILDTNIEKIDDLLPVLLPLTTAAEDIDQYEACYVNGSGSIALAQADGSSQPVRGLAYEAATSGNTLRLQTAGLMENASWSWTPGASLYLSATTPGALTETAPGSNVEIVAFALTATKIWLSGGGGGDGSGGDVYLSAGGVKWKTSTTVEISDYGQYVIYGRKFLLDGKVRFGEQSMFIQVSPKA